MDAAVGFLDRFGTAILAGYFVVYFLLTCLVNYTLQNLSDKTDAAPSWVAWIPFIQFHAFVRAVGTSYKALLAWIVGMIGLFLLGALVSGGSGQGFFMLLMLVYTLVSVVWFATMFWNLSVRRGLSGWVGLACFIPLLGLLFYLYIAFHDGFVRPSGIGLGVTAALALLAVVGLQRDLQEMRGFLAGDASVLTQDLPGEQQAQLEAFMQQLGNERAAGRTAPARGEGDAPGMMQRLLGWRAPEARAGYPEETEIPDAVVCEPGTTLQGARPPRGSAMWCERSRGGARHGWHLGWYPNGQIREAGRYMNGQREGVWTRFWESGGPKARVHFEADREHGILVLWDELGRTEREIRYVHGEPGSL